VSLRLNRGQFLKQVAVREELREGSLAPSFILPAGSTEPNPRNANRENTRTRGGQKEKKDVDTRETREKEGNDISFPNTSFPTPDERSICSSTKPDTEKKQRIDNQTEVSNNNRQKEREKLWKHRQT
jgi:hypothetical protein